MNYKMIINTIGKILKIEAILLLFPLVVSIIYKDNCHFAFIIPIIILLVLGLLCDLFKPTRTEFFAREGMLIVGLSWIILSLFGALPFIISGEIPNFINAFFETVSGFTTTGASILTDVEALSNSMIFWRSFTHWIGGMGVLVFVLAILPSKGGQNIHILRAESPGPQVGKLVSKIKLTARILYIIYACMTVIQIVILILGKMPVFDAVVNSLATAGTGGFAIKATGIAGYNSFCQVTIAIFMVLFGINFNAFYFILIRNFKQLFKCEEVFWYLGIIFISTTIISVNLCLTNNLKTIINIRDSFFTVSSIITTTGFGAADFNYWPALSQTIIIILMFIGGCAGSTAGGIKVSRIVLLFKNFKRNIKKLIHPRSVESIHFEGQKVDDEVISSVTTYFGLIMIFLAAGLLIVSLDNFSFLTNFSAVASCINNVGPGLDMVGPFGSYANFSSLSKLVLIFLMLLGRLEIYPLLVVFNPKVWLNK